MQNWITNVAGYLGSAGAPEGSECVLRQYGVTGASVGASSEVVSNLPPFLLEVGTPISQADAANFTGFAVGNYDRHGILDLFCIKTKNTGSGALEVHILNGRNNYQSFLLETGTPISQADAANFTGFAVGDYNGDGIPDLFCIKTKNTGSGALEVHILNGADNYQSFLLETGTPISQADAANFTGFGVGDFNGDGVLDLYCIKTSETGSGTLEIHILDGASIPFIGSFHLFLLETKTPIIESDAANFRGFGLADFDGDRIPDLYCIKTNNTGSGTLEVHVLSGGNGYQSFLLETGTSIAESDALNFKFAVGVYNDVSLIGGLGTTLTPDLYCLKSSNIGTDSLEVHIYHPASEMDVQKMVLALQEVSPPVALPQFSSERLFIVFTRGMTFPGYGNWCAYHNQWPSLGSAYFALCPYPTSSGCGSGDPMTSLQSITSHEIFEAATDPAVGQGWTTGQGGDDEGGDVCAWQEVQMPFGTIQRFADNSQNACSVWTPVVIVPDLTDDTLAAARQTVQALGLLLASHGVGIVISQSPEAGASVVLGSTIKVVLSNK